jgi:hypothetical protein
MAVYKIFPEKDTTLYSKYPDMNTGLDQILEISNERALLEGSTPYASRVLIKFSTDEIDEVLNTIVTNTYNQSVFSAPVNYYPNSTLPIGSYTASLRLYLADASNLPDTYSLECYSISQSWEQGTGRYLYDPYDTQNATWRNRDNTNEWLTASFFTNTTASFQSTNPGGGTWWFNYAGSQTFGINQSKDINLDVTNITELYSGDVLINDGFLLKMTGNYELTNTSSYSLKYFSRDTHTIYLPQLEIKWDDSVYNTGSLTLLTNENIAITLGNNIGKYNRNDVYQFRVNARDIYPARQFTTVSVYTLNKALPSSSYWALQDLNTGEYVINFDENCTKLSCDPSGNYFNMYMAGLQPERYYKILIKSSFGNGSTVVYDNAYIFKLNK